MSTRPIPAPPRGEEQFVTRVIDLTVARADAPFHIGGKQIAAISQSAPGANITVRLGREGEPFVFILGRSLTSVPGFSMIYLTHAAQAGVTITLAISSGDNSVGLV